MGRSIIFKAAICLLVMAGGLYAQKTSSLRVQWLADGTDIKNIIAAGPVYALAQDKALVAGGPGQVIFSGDIDKLRWVIVRRNGDPSLVAGRSLFTDGERYLLAVSDIPYQVYSRPEDYWVKPLKSMNLAADSVIINPNLAYNPAIAEIVNQVDSARLRSWVTAMQNFGTRHVNAGNHVTVTNWIQTQFTDMGIADVRLDTCYNTTGHNVIATIPGLYDTATIYLAGGHYDSYATSNAPGADDNASGAVAALEYARILSQAGNRPNSTVKLVCFDAEELGLYGSEYLSARLASQGARIGCMLNFDMCGAENNDSLFYSQRYAGSTAYAQLLIRMARLYGRHADTNMVGQYGTQYLQQSDSYPFQQEGYPVAWVLEKNFSTVYHSANDNTSHMNFRYLTGNIKGGLGLLATLAFHPAMVSGVQIQENGSGTELHLTWSRDRAANIIGYRIYWGRQSENYTGQLTINDPQDTPATVSGLMPDSLYYLAVVAVNDQNQESVFIREYPARPFAGTAQIAFYDDFASGLSQWTRGHLSGTVDWDTTSASCHSPNHSVTDSRLGNYANNVNSWLAMANSLNLTGYFKATLSWWERYSTESGWDYCYPEISLNGGITWDSLFIPKYSGSKTIWSQKVVDLTPKLSQASNFKLRFRLRTDGSIVDDGWYVDDVKLTGYLPAGVSSSQPTAALGRLSANVYPNPAGRLVRFSLANTGTDPVRIDIYDVAGRHLAGLEVDRGGDIAEWGLKDDSGRRVANGVYFYRARSPGAEVIGRFQVLR